MNSRESDAFYSIYSEYNKTLRGWLIGFGVGLPGVLLANQELLQLSEKKQALSNVFTLILIGIGVQIFVSCINKTCNWLNYIGAQRNDGEGKFYFAWASALSRQFWIDILADLISVASYTVAAYYSLELLK